VPWAITAVALLVAAIAFALSYVHRAPTAEGNQVLRFIIPLPEKARILFVPAISPDGRHLVHRLNTEDGKELLWLRALRSLDTQPLPGTEGGIQAFWSPDSRSVAFFAGSKLKRVNLSGGAPQTICSNARLPASVTIRDSGSTDRDLRRQVCSPQALPTPRLRQPCAVHGLTLSLHLATCPTKPKA
jgi:hypothetical protein